MRTKGKDLYQELYENKILGYGDASRGMCPGVRYLPEYEDWLMSLVIDLGCGTGDTVRAIKEKGFEADGVDQVDLANNMMVGDITKIMDLRKYKTALCIDVFEHVYDEQLSVIMRNMAQTSRQVISVANHLSKRIKGLGGEEVLHVNIKSFKEWETALSSLFVINKKVEVQPQRMLYLCETR